MPYENDWQRIVFGRYAGEVPCNPDDACEMKALARWLRACPSETEEEHKYWISEDFDDGTLRRMGIQNALMERAGKDLLTKN